MKNYIIFGLSLFLFLTACKDKDSQSETDSKETEIVQADNKEKPEAKEFESFKSKTKPKLTAEQQKALNLELLNRLKTRSRGSIINLLNNGADPNARDETGNTALMLAVINTNGVEAISSLKNTPLEYLIVKALIRDGANVNAENRAGDTALSLTTNEDTRKMLKEAGATR